MDNDEKKWLRDRLIRAQIIRFYAFLLFLGVVVVTVYEGIFVAHNFEGLLAISPFLLLVLLVAGSSLKSFLSGKQPPGNSDNNSLI